MPNRDHPKLSFMGLPQFFFWFPFSVLTLFKPWRKLNRPTLVELFSSNDWQVVGFISSERPCSDYWFSLIEEAWGERRVLGGGAGATAEGGGALVGGGWDHWLHGAFTAWAMGTGWDWGAGVGDEVGLWDQFPRTAIYTINIGLQNGLCKSHTWRLVSWKALRQLNAHWALPLYAVSEDEKSNGSEEKLTTPKIA